MPRKQGFQTAGQVISADKDLVRLTKEPSSVDIRLIRSAEEIRQNVPEEVSFQHTALLEIFGAGFS